MVVEIRVLGPIEVVGPDGESCRLGGPTPTRLLAILVAAGESGIGLDPLCDELWQDPAKKPDDPVGAVRTHVARLRTIVGKNSIITGNGRYALSPDLPVDANQFETDVASARKMTASPALAPVWASTLEPWRGPAFADHGDSSTIMPVAVRLEELRSEATEAAFEARLANGESREIVADLEEAVAANPLREQLRVQRQIYGLVIGGDRQVVFS